MQKLQKHILFLASWYPSRVHPTLGNFTQKHAEIANEIVKVDVLYAVSSNDVTEIRIEENIENSVRTVRVYYPKNSGKLPLISYLSKRNSYLKALQAGYDYLDQNYDLVHLNVAFPAGIFAKWLLKKYNLPYLLTEHWTGFLPQNQKYAQLPFYQKYNYQSIFKKARRVLPVSDYLGDSLIQLGLIEKYSTLYNVIDSSYFFAAEEVEENRNTVRFLHISTFEESHKNISGMLSAFSQLKREYTLHLVTEFGEKSVWKSVEKHKVPKEKCIVESQLSAKEIGEAMRKADCLVLFSNYETFSAVLGEAWMSGLPCIYSKCGGLTEINDKNLGIQIEAKNIHQLNKTLEYFSPKNYSKEKIIDFAKQFSEKELKERLLSIYRNELNV